MIVDSRIRSIPVMKLTGMLISLWSSNLTACREGLTVAPKPLPVLRHIGGRLLPDLHSQPLLNRSRSGVMGEMTRAPLLPTVVGSHRFRLRRENLTGKMECAKYLLLDSRIVGAVTGAELVVGKAVKHKCNPLMLMDKPWEVTVNNLYPNILYDEQRNLFRCWYLVYGSGRYDGLCYAESRDGIVWEKPNLGLVELNGSKDNNLIRREGSHGRCDACRRLDSPQGPLGFGLRDFLELVGRDLV